MERRKSCQMDKHGILQKEKRKTRVGFEEASKAVTSDMNLAQCIEYIWPVFLIIS